MFPLRRASDWSPPLPRPLPRRQFLRELFGAAALAHTSRTVSGRTPSPGVTVTFEDCSTAHVTDASAVRALSVYYARRFGTRVARFDLPATTTDRESYRPLHIRYRSREDRTTVTLAGRGSLVRVVVVEPETGARIASTNDSGGCVPPRFNDPPSAAFTAATGDTSVIDSGTLETRVGDPVTFTSTATDPDLPHERLRSAWDLDDDGAFERRGHQVTTVYDEPGTVVVTARIRDDFDESVTVTLTVTVRPPWRLVGKLTPATLKRGDQFGIGVSVSGDTLVVGAPGDDERGTDAGAAYVFDLRDLAVPPTRLAPVSLGRRDLAAMSLVVSEDSLAVSAVCDDDEGTDSGAVYVYDPSDLSATPTKLVPETLVSRDFLGFSVDVSDETLVAGAHLDDERADWAGSVFVFDLTDPAGDPVKLAPTDLAVRDLFGISVAVTESVVVCGAAGADDRARESGVVYVYDRADLSATPTRLAPVGLEAADQFGRQVTAVNDTLAVGVPFDDDRGEQAGAVYVYDLSDLATPPTKLVPEGLAPGDLFGYSVALSNGRLAVGAIGDDEAGFDCGAVYVYDVSDVAAPPTKLAPEELTPGDLFGFVVSTTDDALAVGAVFDDDRGPSAGAVYVFER